MLDLQNLLKDQEKLSEIVAVSGFENHLRDYIKKRISDRAHTLQINKQGSLIATITGKKSGKRVLLDAHMDEVGFIINHIDSNGFLYFALMGGWDTRILPALPVKVVNLKGKEFHGVIASKPPHLLSAEETQKAMRIQDLYIDLGMQSKEEVQALGIDIGATGTPYVPFQKLSDHRIRAKALDDRVGINILLQLFDHFSKQGSNHHLFFSFSVQEEVGLKGASAVVHEVEPDLALVVEGTTAADLPGTAEKDMVAQLGIGPALTLVDRSFIANSDLNEELKKRAQKHQIPLQIKKPTYGGTNAGEIYKSLKGIPTAVISVPCRFIHSPVSILDLRDLENTANLLLKFLEELE